MDVIIRTENLVKQFGRTQAVNNISINVEKGEIYGFLGLNGAGKTTLIRMILGMIRPTSGTAYINNTPVKPGILNIWEKVGYLVETPYAYPDLTIKQNLELIRKLRGLTDSSSVLRVMEKLNLVQYQNVLAKHLSLGNAQRLGIAKAIIHDPEIIILDEPANGLDPAGIVEIRELLKDLAFKKGVTIFISSHILAEISKLANRIGIIHEGHLVQELKSTELQAQLRRKLVVNAKNLNKLESILKNNGYSAQRTKDNNIMITDEQVINAPDIIATLLVEEQVPPTLLKVDEEDLESYFLRMVSSKEESS